MLQSRQLHGEELMGFLKELSDEARIKRFEVIGIALKQVPCPSYTFYILSSTKDESSLACPLFLEYRMR